MTHSLQELHEWSPSFRQISQKWSSGDRLVAVMENMMWQSSRLTLTRLHDITDTIFGVYALTLLLPAAYCKEKHSVTERLCHRVTLTNSILGQTVKSEPAVWWRRDDNEQRSIKNYNSYLL